MPPAQLPAPSYRRTPVSTATTRMKYLAALHSESATRSAQPHTESVGTGVRRYDVRGCVPRRLPSSPHTITVIPAHAGTT